MAMSKVKLSSDHVIKGLDELRHQELLCDVHLVAEGAKFPAHRVVLAAASPYFQAMFTGGFKENQMNEITLNETSSKGLESVLDAIYTAELSLSEENVCDVLTVSSQLQLSDTVKHCEKFLTKNISEQTCLTFLSAAEKYDLQEAVDACNKFNLENFDTISQMAEFTNLSKEKLCNYLSSDQLKTSNGETEVFRAALKWFEENRRAKATGTGEEFDLADLMEHVRFPLIPNDLLSEEMLTNGLILENTHVMEMVREAVRFHGDNIYSQPLKEGRQFQPRGDQMLAVIHSTYRVTGQYVTTDESKLYMIEGTGGRPFETKFSEQALPVALRPCLSAVTKGNYLFLFGTEADHPRPIALRFDVKTNTWLDLRPPPQKASVYTAVTLLKGNIYLLGGAHLIKGQENKIDQNNLSACVSQYSIETNSWSKLQNLPRPLMFHAAASHGNYVFCAGGCSQSPGSDTATPMEKLYAWDMVGKIWLTKASMKRSRALFSLEAVGEKLVACGGKHSPDVEIYDIVDDQWTLIQNGILENHSFPATIVKDNKVYVIAGGFRHEDGTWVRTDYVSCVDIDKCSVRRVSNLPFKVGEHACALLTVPHTAARVEGASVDDN